MRIRENLSGIIASVNKEVYTNPSTPQIGKVFGVVTTENTPTRELFEKAGGWNGIGTIFYLDYEASKNTEVVDLNTCKKAKPFYASTQNYPLKGELVYLVDGPAVASQIDNVSSQKYYTGTINLWNNNQINSPTDINPGNTFSENADIRRLVSFEGDTIYQGRKGNGIRFGSTVPLYSNISEWSRNGRPSGDPITILVNGYVTTDTGSLTPNIEEVNKEMSSIYMTSTQTIPLQPGTPIINPILSSISPEDYVDSQIILNSDRVTLNSKKDEVLLFAKTDIEISANNVINLNASNYIHLNIESKNPDSKILLGTKANNTVPDEPVLLGGQTHDLLLEMCNTLRRLAGYLANANAVSSDGAIPIIAVQDGADQLLNDVNNLINKLGTIQSDKVFTV
jgi:hypothetical protein